MAPAGSIVSFTPPVPEPSSVFTDGDLANQKVTFASDTKPPNCVVITLHTKPKDVKDVEKDIVLVMSQTGVAREMAVAALRKHDGDIIFAIMELVCD